MILPRLGEMMRIISIVTLATLLTCIAVDANARGGGRQPCDRGAGGISHCKDGKFVCNNGAVSRSKKTCMGYGGSGVDTKKKGKQK